MPAPSQNSTGAVCLKVVQQSHLAISTTEETGVDGATEFYIITWSGSATTEDCRGCTDGTNTVPVRGDTHPENSSIDARRVEIRPADNDSRIIFQARIEYSDDTASPINPLLAQPEIVWDVAEDGQVPYFLDNDPAGQKMVLNKAGERFSEFLQRYQGAVGATFSINVPVTGTVTGYNGSSVSAFSISTAINYCAGGTNQSTPATNSDVFTFDGQSIAIGQAIAKSCGASAVQIQNGVKYRVMKWQLLFKSSWIDYIDNRGFNQKGIVAGNRCLVPITKVGTPEKVDFPWPLTILGQASPNVDDTPPVLSFVPYRQLAFSSLGFS